MGEPVLGIVGANPFHGRAHGFVQGFAGASLGRAQPSLNLLQPFSMGLKSGEYGGKNITRALHASMRSRIPVTLWTRMLSSTTTSPGRKVGPST